MAEMDKIGGRTLSADEPLFYLQFKTKKAVNLENVLSLASTKMQGEAIAETNQALGFELQFIEATKVKQPITFSLYPNPSTGLVNLSLPYTPVNATLQVLDNLGKEVFTQFVTDLQTTIDLTHLTNGIYHIQLHTSEETISKRFVKIQ